METICLKECVAEFLAYQGARNLAAGTRHVYAAALLEMASFMAQHGCKTSAAVEFRHLEAWTVALHRRKIGTGVRRARIFLAKKFFGWLRERGVLLSDPAHALEVPRKAEPLPENPPDAAAMQRLIDLVGTATPLDQRDRAAIEVLYGCMLRISEALALDLADVDLDECLLAVRRGKGGKARVVPVPRKTAEALSGYLEVRRGLFFGKRPKGDARHALFLSRRGGRLATITARQMVEARGREAGIVGLHPHLLRHAGAVHMLRGQADIRHVQELLGHSQLDTTKTYLRLVPSELKKAYDESFPALQILPPSR